MITSGMLGITTISIAVWTARHNAKLARETRTQQRLAESYLEVLRIVEREGQQVEASITNWEIAVKESEAIPIPEDRFHTTDFQRVKMPEPPAITDRATIAAHLAAFGSDNVRSLYRRWQATIAEIGLEEAVLRSIADESYLDGPSLDQLWHLQMELHPNEISARRALADAIAEELGHR